MVPSTGWVASAAPICPRLRSVMMSLVQVLKPASLPMEPKKLMTVSASTTLTAISRYISRLMNWVSPKAMVNTPHRI